MKDRQNHFAIAVGIFISALGGAIALSGLAGWSLALVGIAIAVLGVVTLQPDPQSRMQLNPVRIKPLQRALNRKR